MRRRFSTAILAVALASVTACGSGGALSTDSSGGENYPSRPITITVPADPGSGWDLTARALAQTLQKEGLAETPLPVQNRPGAIGSVWLSQMVNTHKGADDQLAVTSLPVMGNKIRGETQYGYKDVTMISVLFSQYMAIFVPADSPYQDLDDLITAIKRNPKSVPIAGGGDQDLPVALMVEKSGGDPKSVNSITYVGGSGQFAAALLNGEVKAATAGFGELRGQVEAGKLRALAIVSDERLEAPFDNIPTAKEQGYDVTLANWRGVYGPPEMPDYAVKYWRQTLKKAMQTDTWKGLEERNQWVATYMDGNEMQRYLAKTNDEVRDAMRATGQAK